LTGRCDRPKTPSALTTGGNKILWVVLAIAAALLILGLLLWLIMKRGTAH
jgi:type IV secretory pathway TrbD component